MLQNYSENWRQLKSILTGFSNKNREHKLYWYSDHIHAKALAIFLAHATLATPKMDRITVSAVLAGQQVWPHSPDAREFEGVSLPLSVLEEFGLVSFYSDWCTVHCSSPNQDDVDPSLIPLIKAIEHLKNILWGQDGYTQPHHVCPADELQKILADNFGSKSVAELLPELRLEKNYFMLPPGNKNFDSLVSTYLWQTLRATLEPKEAFERWMLCLRVNCGWAMPMLFGDHDHEQTIEFNNQFLAYIAQDGGLLTSLKTLQRQIINKNEFSHITNPVSTELTYTIDADGNNHSKYQNTIELEKPTLDSLDSAYPSLSIDHSSDLQFVIDWHQARHWHEPHLFYTWLLHCSIEDSIRIDSHVLASYGFVEKILELAASRPVLKYILFNVIPDYQSVTYRLFLLSQPATCDIAFFHLTLKSLSIPRRDDKSSMHSLDKGYQNLVCLEYLRAIKKESDSGDRLLKAIDLLGNRCNFHDRNFPERHEYQFLLCFLDKLNHQHVVQLGKTFTEWQPDTKITHTPQRAQHHWYFLGFWLIERIERLGLDLTGTSVYALKENLLGYYRSELEKNLAGKEHSLEPNEFFSSLPWHKLILEKGSAQLLEISNRCGDWQKRLSYENKNNFAAASAIRNYLLVLMCAGRPQRMPLDWKRIASRITEIVRTLGFGPHEEAIHLFNSAFYRDEYDLWSQFCSYTNLLEAELYDDLFDRCLPSVPLDQLFILLERCTVVVRTQALQEMIATQQSPNFEELGLSSLEKAFILAWETGNHDQASRIIDTAKKILDKDRFQNTKNHHILMVRKKWQSYVYKWQLLKLLDRFSGQPDEYANEVHQVLIPHKNSGNYAMEDDRVHWLECEQFKRYVIAAAYCETAPKKSIKIMEVLCKENSNCNFSFMLFKGRFNLYGIDKDKTRLRYGLAHFLNSVIDVEPKNMSQLWIAHILDTYRQLEDQAIDDFWLKLSPDQQARLEILRPYCMALIKRGDRLIAQQIITRYQDINLQASDELGIDDLVNELFKTSEISMTQLIQVTNESSERSIVQLKKHYRQIITKDFEDYVTIVSQGLEPHEFLKEVVLDVANELLLRKKNLQLHSYDSIGETNFRITKEDLINDWFTSLFDKRMAEARIGFRDQKRGGESESGKSPGEIDGYITDQNNKRIAIFEAFRLFSIDTKVIATHIDKIAGYDNESLSPVFIVAYCDVNDFGSLVSGYYNFITKLNYTGFTTYSQTANSLRTLDRSDHLWLGMEQRSRGHKEIIFYHLLLNIGSQ